VFCIFCGNSSKNEDMLKKCGPIYGSFKDCTKLYYLHENCALWTPGIYLDDNGWFKNVKKEIKRCKDSFCSYCGKRGGGLGCSGTNCEKTYHYYCAKLDNCKMDNHGYHALCVRHHSQVSKFKESTNFKDCKAELCYCEECKSSLDEDKFLKW